MPEAGARRRAGGWAGRVASGAASHRLWYSPVTLFRLHTSSESENTYHLYFRRTSQKAFLRVFFFTWPKSRAWQCVARA